MMFSMSAKNRIHRREAKSRKQRFRQLDSASNQGLNASTIELAERYLHDFPESGWAWFDYGRALIDFAQYKEAEAALKRASKLLPSEHLRFVYSYLGHLYKRKGDYRKAANWYEKAVDLTPDNADCLNFLGAVFDDAGDLTNAARCFRQGTKCHQGAIDEAYYNLGCIFGAERKYDKALVCFDRALEIDPKYKVAKQAKKDMKKVLEITGNPLPSAK
jgi:tetratricopeptide (TPR) repeat protein